MRGPGHHPPRLDQAAEGKADLPFGELGREWAARRGLRALIHVDAAAAGRTSRGVHARIVQHLADESDHGGYIAEAAAAEEVTALQNALGHLLGVRGENVTFVESSSNALAQLIDAWPFERRGTIWAVRSEWGPNLAAFADRGLVVEWLRTEPDGGIDLDALARRLRTARPAAVHLAAAASHRALVQPLAAITGECDRFQVPVIVDAAQALGQVAIQPGAAAIYGTGRKWLCGPRGVGYLAVHEAWEHRLHPVAPALTAKNWPVGSPRPIARLGSREAFIAGRLGLGVAVAEYIELEPERIRERLHKIAYRLRLSLADLPAWRLRDPPDAPGALVVLEPRSAELNVPAACSQLLNRGVLTTACPPARAPHDMTGYVLRLSPHLETTTQDIDAIVNHLRDIR